jgi:hypothetical protein
MALESNGCGDREHAVWGWIQRSLEYLKRIINQTNLRFLTITLSKLLQSLS